MLENGTRNFSKYFPQVPKGGGEGESKKFFDRFCTFFGQKYEKKFEKKIFFFLDPKFFLRPHVGLKGFQLAIKDFLVEKIAFRC